MSLIACPECAHNVSDAAHACPGCGYPVGDHLMPVVIDSNASCGPDCSHFDGPEVDTKASDAALARLDDLAYRQFVIQYSRQSAPPRRHSFVPMFIGLLCVAGLLAIFPAAFIVVIPVGIFLGAIWLALKSFSSLGRQAVNYDMARADYQAVRTAQAIHGNY